MRALLGVLLLAGSSLAADRPNVIVILADDLGVNDLGCYGRADHATPHLDRLAKQGTRYTAAYASCPVCSPTRAAFLTGMNPARLHITTFLPGRADAPSQKLLHPKIANQLPPKMPTLPGTLKTAGYATGVFGKWHVGGNPKDAGFDTVYAGKANHPPTAPAGGKGEYDLTDQAIHFVKANRDRPFFVYLAHNTPHIPLAASPELLTKFKDSFNPLYAATIASMDESVGKLLGALDEMKLTGTTYVLFTSDNGGLHVPELKDDAPTHNTPFRAGKGFVYEGGIRVPAILRGPGVPAGATDDRPFQTADWCPTILGWCGAKLPGLDGVPLGTGPADRPLFWHVPHYTNQGSRPAGAVRQGKWKLIEHYEDQSRELYDLTADPGETKNRLNDEPAIAARLGAMLKEWRTQVGAQENRVNPMFNPAPHQKLYIEVDVSRLTPKATAAETSKPLAAWRQLMDSIVKP